MDRVVPVQVQPLAAIIIVVHRLPALTAVQTLASATEGKCAGALVSSICAAMGLGSDSPNSVGGYGM